jgi:electron transport complex protein RnfC
MKTKYPQGDERQLIYALTGREIPTGKLPEDAGCVVFNAHTCAAVYTAIATGMPSVRRIITVSGDCIATPKNLSVPVGVPASLLVEYCGGLVKTPEKMIFGGPMMGQAQLDAHIPVKKSTSAILYLSRKYSAKPKKDTSCIRCGRCVSNCPMHLMPLYIAMSVRNDDMKAAERYGAMSCVECGSCSYNCPAKVEIVQYIRVAKNYISTESAHIKEAEADAEK